MGDQTTNLQEVYDRVNRVIRERIIKRIADVNSFEPTSDDELRQIIQQKEAIIHAIQSSLDVLKTALTINVDADPSLHRDVSRDIRQLEGVLHNERDIVNRLKEDYFAHEQPIPTVQPVPVQNRPGGVQPPLPESRLPRIVEHVPWEAKAVTAPSSRLPPFVQGPARPVVKMPPIQPLRGDSPEWNPLMMGPGEVELPDSPRPIPVVMAPEAVRRREEEELIPNVPEARGRAPLVPNVIPKNTLPEEVRRQELEELVVPDILEQPSRPGRAEPQQAPETHYPAALKAVPVDYKVLGRLPERTATLARAGAHTSGQVAMALGKGAVKVVGMAGKGVRTMADTIIDTLEPKSVPTLTLPEGDTDFFIRLKQAELVLENLRVAEAKINALVIWNPTTNQTLIRDFVDAAKRLAKETVLASIRFIAEKSTDVSVGKLNDAIIFASNVLNDANSEINNGFLQNEVGQPIVFTPELLDNLQILPSAINRIRSANATAASINAMNSVDILIDAIQSSPVLSLTRLNDSQLAQVADFDATVIRNLAARAVGLPMMTLPTIDNLDDDVMTAISIARKQAEGFSGGIRPEKTLKSPTKSQIQKIIERLTPLPLGPTVKDLGSAFDRKSAEILKKRGLGQSPEVVKALAERREAQLKKSVPFSYVTDMTGTTTPVFPTQVVDSLLPFVLVANILVSIDPSGDGSPVLNVDEFQKIQMIESIMELTISMSDARRLLADNLELTLGASRFGYFVEPSKVKIVERMAGVIDELPKWTREVQGMSVDRFRVADVDYLEKAMLSIISAVTDYCAVCQARSGGVCDIKNEFVSATDNVARVTALRKIGDAAISANPHSVLGEPILALCTAIDRMMTNPANHPIRLSKLDVKGEFVKSDKSEGTAEERLWKSIASIHKSLNIVNYNVPVKEISWKLVREIITDLDNVIRDLEAMASKEPQPRGPKEDEMREIITDLRVALKLIVEREESQLKPTLPWNEGNRVLDPTFLSRWGTELDDSKKEAIRNLYRDLTYVVTSKFTRGLTDWFSRKRNPENLPASQTEEFVKSSPGLKDLPPLIQIEPLVKALKTTPDGLSHNREWYDNLGNALRVIYGTQTTRVTPDYARIATNLSGKDTVLEMERALIQVALPALVNKLSSNSIPSTVLDVSVFGDKLYEDLGAKNRTVDTEALAEAIVGVVRRVVPLGITLDPVFLAAALSTAIDESEQAGRRPTISDLSRLLITEVTIQGALQIGGRPTPPALSQRLAAAIARVGPFMNGQPPSWTGIALPTP